MGLTNTHVVYSPERNKFLMFVPNGNPDKARAIDRTNEVLHCMVAMGLNHGGSFQVNLRGKAYLFGMQDVTVEEQPEQVEGQEPIIPAIDIPAEAEVPSGDQ